MSRVGRAPSKDVTADGLTEALPHRIWGQILAAVGRGYYPTVGRTRKGWSSRRDAARPLGDPGGLGDALRQGGVFDLVVPTAVLLSRLRVMTIAGDVAAVTAQLQLCPGCQRRVVQHAESARVNQFPPSTFRGQYPARGPSPGSLLLEFRIPNCARVNMRRAASPMRTAE